MTFFKVLLATILGFFLSIALMLFLVFGAALAVIVTGQSGDEVVVAERSVLEVDLSDGVYEHRDVEGIASMFSQSDALSLRTLVLALDRARTDKRIAVVRVKASGFNGDWATAEEIREKIEALRAADKLIVATSDANGFSEQEYFIATAADSIVMKPSSRLEINGIGATLMFFKPALDRLGIKPEISRVGKFKSAVEPFTLDSSSPETQMMMRELVNGTFSQFQQAVTKSRGISPERLDAVVNGQALLTSHEALREKLIDAVLYEDQIEARLRVRTGRTADQRLRTVSIAEYASSIETDAEDQIAIVYAVGTIASGESEDSPDPLSGGKSLGEETFGEAMKTARESDAVKAVVVRIDSPGGEATASEEMWRQIRLTADEKPVIASMGSTAASGGYYIAVAADSIVADATTITGSIGVFGLWFNAGEFMRETLGINTQVITSDSLADMMSAFRATTPLERSIIQRSVDSVYQRFLQVVADGRGITMARAHELGQGRVYTGAEAKRLGLVDEIGGIGRAIEIAAAAAELDTGAYSLRVLPLSKSFFETIMKYFGQGAGISSPPVVLAERVARELERRSGVQMRMIDVRLGN